MLHRVAGAALLAVCLTGVPACRERSGPNGQAARTTSPPPTAPLAPSASTPPPPTSTPSPSPEPPPTCSAACAPGTSCRLTEDGPACAACAPGSLPTCKDDRFVVGCDARGAVQTLTDCAAQKKRCDRGRCVAPECTPGALHCHEGDVYRCSPDGTTRALVTACVKVEPDGALGVEKGLCQEKNGKAACRTRCDLPDHTIIALRGCDACAWEAVPFCATESPERGCMDWICLPDHGFGPGAVSIPCFRDTEGLAVPGSERPGPCEGAAPVGARKVAYEVCRQGKPEPAARVEPCRR